MNLKSRFTLSIMGYTVLLIGFLTLAFVKGMFLLIEGFNPENLGFMIIGIGLSTITLRKIIRLNKEEISSREKGLVKNHHEFIAQWVIKSTQWSRFTTEKLKFDRSESDGYGLTLGTIIGVIAGFISFKNYSLEYGLLIGASSFLGFFLLGKFGTIFVARNKFNKLARLERGEVHFAREVIVFNHQLIILTGFGQALRSFVKERRFGMEVLNLRVQTGFGNRKNTREFLIPIPSDHEEQAKKLLEYYSGLVE